MRLASRPPHLCRSGAPAPDPFGSRCSRTTDGETHIVTLAIAGDRPPRYGKKKRFLNDRGGQAPALRLWRPASFHRRARACPSPVLAHSNDRGGQAPALRLARPASFHRRVRACPSPCLDRARLCRSGAPAPDPFGSRRSRTTDGETHIVTLAIAGDRPPRYDKITVLKPSRGKPARMRVWHPRAPALR